MTPDYSSKILAERYHLRRQIGHGGMATVYEAIDSELNKPVAVKILNPNYASQAEYLARFRQEAREAARIRHENLVDVTDQGSTPDGLAYFVMEFLRGQTLQSFLHPAQDQSRPVPWRIMVPIVAQVCDALQHAHEHGVIHRDIKPGNIVLLTRRSGEFRVKVLDLGIAKVLHGHRDPRTAPTTRASQGTPGTPEYMSPEQVRGTPDACAQTDLYAVGVMMYRMLTGKLPFFSELSPYDVMEQHCKQLPEPPSKRAPALEIPEALEREVMRALAKHPEERQGSAQELADTLRALAAAETQRERLLRDKDEAHTLRYRVSAGPPRRTLARLLSYIAALFGGMTLSTTLFMVFLLFPWIPSRAGDPSSRPVRLASIQDSTTPAASAPESPPPPSPSEAPPIAEPPVTPAAPIPDPIIPDPIILPDPIPDPIIPADPIILPDPIIPATPSAEDTGDAAPEPEIADPPEPPVVVADDVPDDVADDVPQSAPDPSPEKQLAEFLHGQRRTLDRRCGQMRILVLEEIPVRLELAPEGGAPRMVTVDKVLRSTPRGACVATVLRRLAFPALGKTTFKRVIVRF